MDKINIQGLADALYDAYEDSTCSGKDVAIYEKDGKYRHSTYSLKHDGYKLVDIVFFEDVRALYKKWFFSDGYDVAIECAQNHMKSLFSCIAKRYLPDADENLNEWIERIYPLFDRIFMDKDSYDFVGALYYDEYFNERASEILGSK